MEAQINIRKNVAELLHWLHVGVLVTSLTGWLIFSGVFLKYYAGFMAFMLVQWIVNDNRCFLTSWEQILRDGKISVVKNAESTFIGKIYKQIMGQYPSYFFVNASSYGLTVGFLIIALVRIYAADTP